MKKIMKEKNQIVVDEVLNKEFMPVQDRIQIKKKLTTESCLDCRNDSSFLTNLWTLITTDIVYVCLVFIAPGCNRWTNTILLSFFNHCVINAIRIN